MFDMKRTPLSIVLTALSSLFFAGCLLKFAADWYFARPTSLGAVLLIAFLVVELILKMWRRLLANR